DWLRSYLGSRGGRAVVTEVREAAWRALGIRATVLDRARHTLGVRVRQTYVWELPAEHELVETESDNESGSDKETESRSEDVVKVADDPGLGDPDAWSKASAGQAWGNCEVCGARVQWLYRGRPRCWPRCDT